MARYLQYPAGASGGAAVPALIGSGFGESSAADCHAPTAIGIVAATTSLPVIMNEEDMKLIDALLAVTAEYPPLDVGGDLVWSTLPLIPNLTGLIWPQHQHRHAVLMCAGDAVNTNTSSAEADLQELLRGFDVFQVNLAGIEFSGEELLEFAHLPFPIIMVCLLCVRARNLCLGVHLAVGVCAQRPSACARSSACLRAYSTNASTGCVTLLRTRVPTHIHTRIRTRTHAHTIHTRTRAHAHTHTVSLTHAHTHTHKTGTPYTHTHIHTHTHTPTNFTQPPRDTESEVGGVQQPLLQEPSAELLCAHEPSPSPPDVLESAPSSSLLLDNQLVGTDTDNSLMAEPVVEEETEHSVPASVVSLVPAHEGCEIPTTAAAARVLAHDRSHSHNNTDSDMAEPICVDISHMMPLPVPEGFGENPPLPAALPLSHERDCGRNMDVVTGIIMADAVNVGEHAHSVPSHPLGASPVAPEACINVVPETPTLAASEEFGAYLAALSDIPDFEQHRLESVCSVSMQVCY